jgi:hypothetical protein
MVNGKPLRWAVVDRGDWDAAREFEATFRRESFACWQVRKRHHDDDKLKALPVEDVEVEIVIPRRAWFEVLVFKPDEKTVHAWTYQRADDTEAIGLARALDQNVEIVIRFDWAEDAAVYHRHQLNLDCNLGDDFFAD